MRQVDLDRLERLFACATKVVDLPLPSSVLFAFLPKHWRTALLDLASAVNDIRLASRAKEITIVAFRQGEHETTLFIEEKQ